MNPDSAAVGTRVVVPGGRVGTVTGVKEVYVQLDGVGSRNSVAVDRLTAIPEGNHPSTPPDAGQNRHSLPLEESA